MDLHDAIVGTTLAGRYRIVRELGRGGFGVVYEAVDVALDRRVALKVLFEVDAKTVGRFQREAVAAAQIDHRNVARIHAIVVDETGAQKPFIVTEYLEGETLRQLLDREAPLPVQRAARICAELLEGLAAAHAANVVHRDVKSANVFLAGGVVKLLDFGLAKLVDDATSKTTTGHVFGTPGYLPPERIKGGPGDARSDVFAVGVTLFEMLAGTRPWRGRGGDLYVEVLTADPLPLETFAPAVPAELAAVVRRALEHEPDARFESANAMRAALRPWTEQPAPPPSRRRWPVFAAALAVTLAAGAGLAALAVRNREPTPTATADAAPTAVVIATAPEPEQSAVLDALPAPSATEAHAPAARPVTRCRCIHELRGRFYGPLCVKPESPRKCYCAAGSSVGGPLCREPWGGAKHDPVCPASFEYVGRESEPCDGYGSSYDNDWNVISYKSQGVIACAYCDAKRAARETFPAVHGTACKGYQEGPYLVPGQWVCEK